MPEYLDTGGQGCSPTDYFFKQTQEVITIDEENSLIGINNTTPQHDLDVGGTIATSNLLADGIVYSSNILNTGTLETHTAIGSNITATQSLQGFTVDAQSNIYWNGYSLYDECPIDTNEWSHLIPFKEDVGMIHESWIRKPISAMSVLQDLWSLASTGIDIAEAVADAYQFFKGTEQQALTQAAVDALSEALDNLGNETTSNPKIVVSWSNLKNKPIANNNTTIGIDGDLYIHPSKSLKVLDQGTFTTDVWNNTKFSSVPTGSKVIDFSTKEAFLSQITLSNSERASIYQPDEIITDCNFKIGTLRMDFESASNTKLYNTQSNITINDIVLKKDDYGIPIVSTDTVEASTFRDANNFNSALNFLSFQSAWQFSDRYDTGAYSSNYQDWANTYLFLKPKTLELKTQDRPVGGVGQPLVTQFSINSNGTLYCRSNIQMNSPATVRSVQTTIDDYPREGLLTIEPTVMRYIQKSNVGGVDGQTINWSVNSNGMFLLQRNAIYGKTETAYSNFTRLKQTLENGLIWGRGLSNDFGTDADLFQFKQNGELYTADYIGTMKRHINSNAEIQKGTMVLDNTGNLKINNSNVILSSGTIQRRIDPNSNAGFQVSPSGYMTMGNLNITPEGILTSTSQATFSNLTASNINAVSITSVNTTESNIYTSNVNAMAIIGSNLSSEIGTFKQGLTIGNVAATNFTLSNGVFLLNNASTSNLSLSVGNLYMRTPNLALTLSNSSTTNLTAFTFSGEGRFQQQSTQGSITGSTMAILYHMSILTAVQATNDIRASLCFGNNQGGTPGVALWYYRTNNNGGDLQFATKTDPTLLSGALSAKMTIRYNGNVGIGTTTPSNLLDVNGNANATSFTEAGIALSNKYALSNAQSNYTPLSNFTAFSNWSACNFIGLSNAYTTFSTSNFPAYSNWSACNFVGLSNDYTTFSISNFPSFSNWSACNFIGLSNAYTTFSTSNFPAYSNWSACNFVGLSNAYSNFTLTAYPAFSNWSSCNFVGLSNAYSNFTSTTFPSFSNTTWCNMGTINNIITGVSNWTDATFRKKSVNVDWGEISGKPNFGTSNNSIDFAGVGLGTAGLLFGGAALLNQNGQLVGALQNVAGTLKLNTSGYSRMDEGLKLLGDGVNGITLDPSGAINALTGSFNYSKLSGPFSLWASNSLLIYTSNTTSNMVMGSNSITVLNNLPFTISNANVITNCNISSPSFSEGGVTLSNKYTQITDFVGLSNAYTTFTTSTYTGFSNWSSCNFIGLSNAYTTFTTSNYTGFSNWSSCNFIGLSNTLSNTNSNLNAFSNWVSPVATTNRLWTNSNANVYSYSNIGIGTSNPAYPLEVIGTAKVDTLNVGTATITSNAITLPSTESLKITTSNIINTTSIRTFTRSDGYNWRASNNTYTKAIFNWTNFHNTANSYTTAGFDIGHTSAGSGSLGIYCLGYSNGTYNGYMPIQLLGKTGIGTANPSYDFDVAGTANATTLRENTTLLTDKYALSNTQSNYTLLSTYTTYSNYITQKAEWSSNSLSNFSTSVSYNAFSNWVSPLSIWGSNN